MVGACNIYVYKCVRVSVLKQRLGYLFTCRCGDCACECVNVFLRPAQIPK